LLNNQSDFRWNALYTSDSDLETFLNSKQSGGDWESTQTIAPTNLATGTVTDTSVELSWTVIPYIDDAGGYEIYHSVHHSELFPEQSVISSNADGPYSVYAADIDGDGDMDVLSASYSDDKIAWYENTDGRIVQ